MKVAIAKKTLQEALEQTVRAVPRRAALSLLEHVLIQARGGRLFLLATNLETTVLAWREATVTGEGQALVEARPFLEFVKALPDEPVSITLVETRTVRQVPAVDAPGRSEEVEEVERRLEVTCGPLHSAFLAPHDPAEFPLPPKIHGLRVLLDAQALTEAVARVEVAVSRDESRPTLQGILLDVEPPHALTLVATDGYRLATHRLQTLNEVAPTPRHWIVPGRALADIARMLRKQKYRGTVVIDAHFPEKGTDAAMTAFRWPGVSVAVVNIDATYPDWRAIVAPVRPAIRVAAPGKALADALKALKTAASATNAVRLRVNGVFEMTTRAADVGEVRMTVPAEIVGKDGEDDDYIIGANWRYVQDVVKALKKNTVVIGFQEDNVRPMLFTAEGLEETYRYVLMPMKLT